VAQKVDFRKWFDEDELEECPRCGDRTVVVTHTGAAICTECGLLGFRTVDGDGDAATAPPDPPVG
jgi:ribosomal protein S27AE